MQNGQKPYHWTYKTLRFAADGQTCEWQVRPFRFPVMAGAAMAAQAYMLAEAERGNMVVVSLEPCEELKPLTEKVAEHTVMLDALKREFSDPQNGGTVYLWDIIHKIDPNWPNPWNARADAMGMDENCICPPIGQSEYCPVHGSEKK